MFLLNGRSTAARARDRAYRDAAVYRGATAELFIHPRKLSPANFLLFSLCLSIYLIYLSVHHTSPKYSRRQSRAPRDARVRCRILIFSFLPNCNL